LQAATQPIEMTRITRDALVSTSDAGRFRLQHVVRLIAQHRIA
jgi:hypothetical protein